MLSLVFVFAFSLAACSTDGGSQGASDDGNGQGGDGQETASEPVEITFWHVYSDKQSGAVEARVEAFNESQDEIIVNVIGNADDQKQLTAISGGNPPDVAMTYWNNVGPWAANGAVMSLNDMIEQDNYDLDQHVPAALERMKLEDEYYAMPWTMSMASKIMWNKEAFDEAGITEPPETLEDLQAYAEKLTKIRDNGDIESIGFVPDFPWIDNVFWPVIFGGDFEEDGQVTPDNPQNIASLEYQASFYEKYGVEAMNKFKSGMGQRNTPQDPLVTGQIAMAIGWEYDYPDERAEDGPIGVAPFPYPADHPELEGSGMVSPRSVFIPQNSPHPEEAWTFIKWLISEEQQVAYCLDEEVIPTVMPALDSEELRDAHPEMVEFYEAGKSENLRGFPNSEYINEYLQALSEQTELILKGDITAEEGMKKVKDEIQPLADKANQG